MRTSNIKPFLLACLLIVVSAIAAVAQTDVDKITPKETREAKALARRFSARLLQTKDIKPLVKEFFVKDFYQRMARDERAGGSIYLKLDRVLPERRIQLGRFYVAETNWMYLFMLYERSKADNASEDDPLASLPADVRTVFLKDSQTYKAIFEDGTPDMEKPNEYFDKALHLFEKTGPMLRRHAIRINAGHTRAWRKYSEAVAKSIGDTKPWADRCKYYCYGFTNETRLILISPDPMFLLALKKIGGHLRVVGFHFYDPS